MISQIGRGLFVLMEAGGDSNKKLIFGTYRSHSRRYECEMWVLIETICLSHQSVGQR